MLQSLPLDIKVGKSILRIKEFISHYRIDGVYVSFSGGKDSSVLLDVVCKFCVLYGYKKVYVAFSDTGLEFPELKQFVGNYVKYLSLKYKIDVILDVEDYLFKKEKNDSLETMDDMEFLGTLKSFRSELD